MGKNKSEYLWTDDILSLFGVYPIGRPICGGYSSCHGCWAPLCVPLPASSSKPLGRPSNWHSLYPGWGEGLCVNNIYYTTSMWFFDICDFWNPGDCNNESYSLYLTEVVDFAFHWNWYELAWWGDPSLQPHVIGNLKSFEVVYSLLLVNV